MKPAHLDATAYPLKSISAPTRPAVRFQATWSVSPRALAPNARTYIQSDRAVDRDPAKQLSNLAKHGVDFASVEFFGWQEAILGPSLGRGESRLVAVGPIMGRLHVLIFSIENRAVRVISLRKANRREIKLWHNQT